MFCSRCSQQCSDDSKFCNQCGAPVQDQGASESPSTALNPVMAAATEKRRRYYAAVVLVLIAAVYGIATLSSNTHTPPPASTPSTSSSTISKPAQAAMPARRVASWQGNGIKTTEPFRIRNSRLRVSWKVNAGTYGVCAIYAYKGSSGLPTVAAVVNGSDEGNSYVYSGAGEYHLEIQGINCSLGISVDE